MAAEGRLVHPGRWGSSVHHEHQHPEEGAGNLRDEGREQMINGLRLQLGEAGREIRPEVNPKVLDILSQEAKRDVESQTVGPTKATEDSEKGEFALHGRSLRCQVAGEEVNCTNVMGREITHTHKVGQRLQLPDQIKNVTNFSRGGLSSSGKRFMWKKVGRQVSGARFLPFQFPRD